MFGSSVWFECLAGEWSEAAAGFGIWVGFEAGLNGAGVSSIVLGPRSASLEFSARSCVFEAKASLVPWPFVSLRDVVGFGPLSY